MADDKTYSYMYSPKDVPSSGNKYQVGDPSGPLPYAPPGVVQFGTYPEPPEGYNQYQKADGENIRSYDVGTGPHPNVGPGMIPRGYDVPPPPPLRTPERRITATSPTPTQSPSISQQYMNERDKYKRYVGHLDPKYYGSSFATPHERFAAGAHTGATQTAITDQFFKNRMQQGGEQYDTLESYAMDKFNPIPKMDFTEFQNMLENDFRIGYGIDAAMATPLAPSVEDMQERYDALLPPQPKHSLTEARQAANLQARKYQDGTNGVDSIQHRQKPDSMDPRDSASSLYAYSKPKSPTQPVASPQPVASSQPVASTQSTPDAPRPFESKFSAEEMKAATLEMAYRDRHIRDMPDMVQPPDYTPRTQEIADYLKTNLKTLEEGGNIDPPDSYAGTNSLAGTIAGIGWGLGQIGTKGGLIGMTTNALGIQPKGIQIALDNLHALSMKDYKFNPNLSPGGNIAGLASDSSPSDADVGLGMSADPTGDPSGVGSIGVKDGGEVRKYQDGTTDVGSLEPNRMDFIDEAGAAPPSELADDVNVTAREGDVVFPPESVEIMGLLNMNDMIKAALGLALEVGAVVPPDIDPNEKVPVRLTNGEVIIPKVVADAVGKERVEEIINKGLKLRAQREEQAQAQQQAAPQAAPPMPQGLKEGSSGIGKQMDKLLRGVTVDLPGEALDFNVGWDRYDDVESIIDAAKKVGSVFGNTEQDKRKATNLMLRTAAGESGMGQTDRDINRASGEGFTIGPWQVTTTALTEINKRINEKFPGMTKNIAKLKQQEWAKDIPFGKVTEDNLKDPLTNAVYSRLYYSTFPEEIPEGEKEQAQYWKKYYNTASDPHGTPEKFLERIEEARKAGYIK